MGRIGHHIVDILFVTLRPVERHVIRDAIMNERLSVFICGFRIDNNIQFVEIEHDQLSGIFRLSKALCNDICNIVASVADFVGS